MEKLKIIKFPTTQELELTPKQQDELQGILDWEKRSNRKRFVLGEPSWYDPDNPEHRSKK